MISYLEGELIETLDWWKKGAIKGTVKTEQEDKG